MTVLELLAALAAGLALLPLLLVAVNLPLYRRPTMRAGSAAAGAPEPSVSVLIPARNEEAAIGGAVEAALASRGVRLEVVVMDDHSEDRTATVVRAIAGRDPRVRLLEAPPLPPGWCGKQHACQALAEAAQHELLVFLDADVRLAPRGLRAVVAGLESSGADLASGIPRQLTGTLVERLVVPLIHFVLLGFLPLAAMRRSPSPAFGAGCGQLFVTRRGAYRAAGGHAAIRGSRHDGLTLPRAYRRAGLATDLFDATGVATCRMYRGARELWRGFAKNAAEGMAGPAAIFVWTALLGGGQLAPPLLLAASLALDPAGGIPAWAAAGTVAGPAARALLALRFRQSWLGVALHPLGVGLILAIQWHARWRALAGRGVAWKGRLQIDG